MCVDPKTGIRQGSAHSAHNLEHLIGQRATIGVAQHNPCGPAIMRGTRAIDRICGVVLVTIKEMFAVKHRFPATFPGCCHRLADHLKVFFKAGLQGSLDMKVPGLAHKAGCRHLRIQNRIQPRIIGRAAPAATGHAKCHHAGIFQRRWIAEKRVISGVCPGPAALDIIDSDLIQRMGNGNLVGMRKIHTTRLAAVTQRGIKQPDPVIRHKPVPRLPDAGSPLLAFISCWLNKNDANWLGAPPNRAFRPVFQCNALRR